MRVLCSGDWHITENRPRRRVDDYYRALVNKLNFILLLAQKEEVDYIIQPGDFFDSVKTSDNIKVKMIRLFMTNPRLVRPIDIVACFGQHDLVYHSRRYRNTPLAVMMAAGAVLDQRAVSDKFAFWNWSDDAPTPSEGKILVAHKMIVKDKTLWDGQSGYSMAKAFLKKHKQYDLIVTGDNHHSFSEHIGNETIGKSYLINCGSLMRSSIAQFDHKPSVWIYDTETKGLDNHPIPIEDSDDVFNWEDVELEKEHDEEIEAFVKRLSENKSLKGLDYLKNLKEFIEENNISVGVEKMIGEILEACKND